MCLTFSACSRSIKLSILGLEAKTKVAPVGYSLVDDLVCVHGTIDLVCVHSLHTPKHAHDVVATHRRV